MMLSKNGVGIVMLILGLLGANVAEADVATTISTLVQVGSAILIAWNQIQRGNVKWFIFKDE